MPLVAAACGPSRSGTIVVEGSGGGVIPALLAEGPAAGEAEGRADRTADCRLNTRPPTGTLSPA